MAALDFSLHPRQGEAFSTSATEVLYGGAAGGGKSHLMRVAAIVWCAEVPGLQVYLFRRIRDDLIKNHMSGPKGLRAMLAPWTQAGLAAIVGDEVRFWNGSRIYLCHCKDDNSIYKYQGAEIHVLMIDELTHFKEDQYRFLRNRVRMSGVEVPAHHAGRFPRVLVGSNPGNIGHGWVKRTFVTSARAYEVVKQEPGEGGMLRQYIPARLEDNPSLLTDDPDYELRLEGLGSEALVRAMRRGDWDIIEGAYFECWDAHRHTCRPFAIPGHWVRFRAMDWGSAAPFSVGWYAVASEERALSGGCTLPRGGLVKYREWYGARPGEQGVGLKLDAEEVGRRIYEMQAGEHTDYGVLDPAAFAENGGPSIAESLRRGSGHKLTWRPADNARVIGRGRMGGWDQVRMRLIGEGDARPMLVFFDTCLDSIRTIPALQHDKLKPEDVDTTGEDHAGDECRYACMSRPWQRNAPRPDQPKLNDYTPVSASEPAFKVVV